MLRVGARREGASKSKPSRLPLLSSQSQVGGRLEVEATSLSWRLAHMHLRMVLPCAGLRQRDAGRALGRQ